MWTGQLRLSLVSFGVRLYAATESANRVSMNQLHKGCNQRVRNQTVCPTHGQIARDEIVKGYEYEKDAYVIIEQPDLDAIKLKSSRTIELVQFVDIGDIDPLYVDAPYYLGPDGPVAEEAFRVIREAMSKAGKVGIGRFVLHGREHIVSIGVSGKGFLLSTLRYASEVRSGEEYFADVKDAAVDPEQLQLATTIMQSKAKPFDAAAFHDQYQDAFFAIVKAKIAGQKPVFVEDDASPRAFNFIDALKQSVDEAERSGTLPAKPAARKKPPAASVPAPGAAAAAKKKPKSRKTG